MNRKSTIEIVLNHNISTIWEIVTNNQDYSWRSDLKHIEILAANHFTEHYKDGGQMDFTIVEKIENKRYVFNIKNKIISGKWVGKFNKIDEHSTQLVFTEEITFKNPLFYILSFLMINLKKIQAAYMNDLQRKLENVN